MFDVEKFAYSRKADLLLILLSGIFPLICYGRRSPAAGTGVRKIAVLSDILIKRLPGEYSAGENYPAPSCYERVKSTNAKGGR